MLKISDLLGQGIPEELLELVMPDDYSADSRHIFKGDSQIIGSPIFVSKIYSVFERIGTSCSTSFEVCAFVYGSEWINFEVSADYLFESKKVVSVLSQRGILINSNNARSAVKYFQSFIQANLCSLRHIKKYKMTGWNRERFLLPHQQLDEIVDSGNVCSYLENSGDVKQLGKLIRKAWNYTGARLMLDLSLAPVLLKHCGVRNFVVNIYGRSGGGKTAALRLASALWGSPMFMNEFNATVNSMETFALERNDLPTIMNEWQVTDKSSRKQISNSIVHRFGEGRSKARLNRDYTQQIVKEFRSIMLCTAEEPLINSESIQGVRARCMDLEFTPVLGTLSESTMIVDLDLCTEIYSVTQSNYGYIARDFINHVIREKDVLNKEFRNWNETVLAFRPDILPAHAQYLALIAMVDYRFNHWYIDLKLDTDELEKSTVGLVGTILPMLPSKQQQIDSERAYELLLDWISEKHNNIQFAIYDSPNSYIGFKKNEVLYLVPRAVRDFLFSEGFDSVKIFKEWYRAGKISYTSQHGCYGKYVTDFRGQKKCYIDITL